jgi:hypothetical protein
MDEGPVNRKGPSGLKPRIRSAVMRLAPWYYHPAYAAHLARKAAMGYEAPRNPRYSALIVNHYFDQDIAWLRRAATDVAVYELPYIAFIEAASAVLPPEAERFPGYYAPELTPARERFRDRTAGIFDGVAKVFPYDVVVSTSDLFWWAREFQPVLRDRGIPYFVIEKEGLMTPYFYEHYSREFGEHCPPIADHHLVWSERQSYFWRLCGQDPDRISVVGQPRSDFWRHAELWPSRADLGLPLREGRPLVVFFSYEVFFYLSWEMFLRGEFTWEPLRNHTNAAIVAAAKRNPDVDFVVKLHPQQEDSGLDSSELPSNLRIVGGSRLGNPLLLTADVLVMFQSTATIEAMFRDIPIVYPFFGESVDRHIESLLPFHEHGVLRKLSRRSSRGLTRRASTPKRSSGGGGSLATTSMSRMVKHPAAFLIAWGSSSISATECRAGRADAYFLTVRASCPTRSIQWSRAGVSTSCNTLPT